MRFIEFSSPQKPLNPQQAKIASLKKNAELARKALDSERKAQQIAKAQEKIRRLAKSTSF